MKLQSIYRSHILAAAIIAAASPVTFGAGVFTLRTDASGNFVDSDANFTGPNFPPLPGLGTASWSGNGTVTPNLNGSLLTPTFVTGTTGGTLSLGNFYLAVGDPKTFWNGTAFGNSDTGALISGVDLNITVSATGAGHSFNIGGLNQNRSGWRNFAVTNLINVETLTVTYSFSEPLAAVRGTVSNFQTPYLVGLRQAAGTGNFNATGTYENLTVDGVPFNPASFPSATTDFAPYAPNNNTNWGATWNPATQQAFINNQPTSTSNNPTVPGTPGFSLIKVIDLDGGGVENLTAAQMGDGIVQEIERTYSTGMTWEIERNGGGNFSNGTAFYFSFNGSQYADSLIFIPEPSSSILLALGISFAVSYRRRSQQIL